MERKEVEGMKKKPRTLGVEERKEVGKIKDSQARTIGHTGVLLV